MFLQCGALLVDGTAEPFASRVQFVLDGLVFLGSEQFLDQIGAVLRAHTQELGKLALCEHDGLRELPAVQSQQPFHLNGHLAGARGDRNRMVRFVKKVEIARGTIRTADVCRATDVGRVALAGLRDEHRESGFGTIRDPHHLAGRVFRRHALATSLRLLVCRRAAHRVIVPAFLENQLHIGFNVLPVQEPRAQPVAVADAAFPFGVAGNRSVQRECDAVEQRGLARTRLPVDEEHVRSGQCGEVDGVLAFVWSDALESECDELHCAASPRVFARTVSTASCSTSFSACDGARPKENLTKSRSTSISSVVCLRSAMFRVS